MISQPEHAPGEGRNVSQIIRPLRDLAALVLVAAPAVLLFVAVLRLIPSGVNEDFSSRVENSFYSFVNLVTIGLPLLAVLLATLVKPEHPRGKIIVTVALVEYAVAAVFAVLFGVLVGLISLAGSSVRVAFEELLVRGAWLAVLGVAGFAVFKIWSSLYHVPRAKPQPGMYGSPGQQFAPHGQQFGPQPQQFGPQPQQYGPQSQQYGPQPQQYGPQGPQFPPPAYSQPGPGQPGPGQPGPGQPGPGQPHAQPGYAQPAPGQPMYGQPGPGQPGPGQPPYGQPGPGQPGPGQPGLGQPSYAQPGPGQPASGQWGEPAPTSAQPATPPGPFAPAPGQPQAVPLFGQQDPAPGTYGPASGPGSPGQASTTTTVYGGPADQTRLEPPPADDDRTELVNPDRATPPADQGPPQR